MAAAWLRRSRGAQSFFFSAKPAVLWRSVHTSVWWDIDDCRVTKGCDPYSMAGNIRDAIAKLNFKGRVTFTAYGDKRRLDPNVKQALSDTRIKFKHVPYARTCISIYASLFVVVRRPQFLVPFPNWFNFSPFSLLCFSKPFSFLISVRCCILLPTKWFSPITSRFSKLQVIGGRNHTQQRAFHLKFKSFFFEMLEVVLGRRELGTRN